MGQTVALTHGLHKDMQGSRWRLVMKRRNWLHSSLVNRSSADHMVCTRASVALVSLS